MSMPRSVVSLGFILLALAAPAAAQDVQLSFKVGAGPVLGEVSGARYRSGVHLAFEAAYGMGRGQIFGAAQYRIYRARTHEVTQFGTGYAKDAAGNVITGQITRNVLGPDGLPKADGRYDSVDMRRDNLDGTSLNLGYRVPMWLEGLQVQGGLAIHFLKSQQDVTANINVVQDRSVATPVVLGKEPIYTQYQKASTMPGLFAGVRYDATRNVFLETNLTLLSYREMNYVLFSYTGQNPRIETRRFTKPLLEFSIGLNF